MSKSIKHQKQPCVSRLYSVLQNMLISKVFSKLMALRRLHFSFTAPTLSARRTRVGLKRRRVEKRKKNELRRRGGGALIHREKPSRK